jgi:hypothetical protein
LAFLFPVFLFAAQPKEFFLDGLKKLEQRSHKCVELMGGICGVNTFFQSLVSFIRPKTYQPPLVDVSSPISCPVSTVLYLALIIP